MDIKDALYSQLFEALLYKKTVLYENLDLNSSVATKENNIIYMSEKVVQMHEKLVEFQTSKGYLPKNIDYVPVTEETTGPYSQFGINEDGIDMSSEETESSKWLFSLTEAYVDMSELLSKNSLEKIQGFMETNPVQRGLREQVEALC